jgi:hypothetical protein
VLWEDTLLLNPGWSNVHFVAFQAVSIILDASNTSVLDTDGDAAACTSDPSKVIEGATKLRNQICGLSQFTMS